MYKDRERKNAKQRELRERYKHDPKYIAANKTWCHRYYLNQKKNHPKELKAYRDKARAKLNAKLEVLRSSSWAVSAPRGNARYAAPEKISTFTINSIALKKRGRTHRRGACPREASNKPGWLTMTPLAIDYSATDAIPRLLSSR